MTFEIGDILRIEWHDATHDYGTYLEEELKDITLAKSVDIGELVHIDNKRLVLCNRKFPGGEGYVTNYKSLFAIPTNCISKAEKLEGNIEEKIMTEKTWDRHYAPKYYKTNKDFQKDKTKEVFDDFNEITSMYPHFLTRLPPIEELYWFFRQGMEYEKLRRK